MAGFLIFIENRREGKKGSLITRRGREGVQAIRKQIDEVLKVKYSVRDLRTASDL